MSWINFLFSGVGVVVVGSIYRAIRKRQRPKVDTPNYRFGRPGLDQLKSQAHILVVDDKDFEYLDLLR